MTHSFATTHPARVRSIGARAVAAESADRVLLSVAQSASYLRVSEKTLRRRIDEGVLRAFRFGPKLLRIDKADLDDMLTPAHPACS